MPASTPLRPLAAVFGGLLLSLASLPAHAQAVPPEQANQARIDRLLRQMTLEEKVNLIRGGVEDPGIYQGQAGYLPGVPRLGVPSLRFADGPPGVLTRIPALAETATMGVAATFSAADARANGELIGQQARALGIDVVLQPFINMDRDITFARSYNTFGEDPYLTSVMGAAEIRGAQSQHVMAQAKHFVGYDSDAYNIVIGEQALHEVYVAPFAAAVQAGVSSVMCSYNRINGPFACGNPATLKTILKDQLGFRGFVTSDWGAVHSALFLNQGLDMEMPGIPPPDSAFAGLIHTFFRTTTPAEKPAPPDLSKLAGILGGTIPEEPPVDLKAMGAFPTDNDGSTLGAALANGTITEATVTAAARRVLYEMDRFGYLDGQQKHTVTPQPIEAMAAVVRKTAEDAAVLLKNDAALPLTSTDLASLALIGPSAGQVASIGTFGERSGGIPARQVSPLDALRQLAPKATIAFAVDDDMTGTPIPAAALSHEGQPGLQRSVAGAVSTDATLNFTTSSGDALPANTAATWHGTLTVPAAGDYWLYLQVLGGRAVLSLDGHELGRSGAAQGAVHGDVQHATQDNGLPTTDGLDNVRRAIQLTAGPHELQVSLSGDTSNQPAQIRLNWMTPAARLAAHQAALDAARHAHTAVVFLWTRGKPAFSLPGEQDKLVEEIAAVNPNTIVVLNTSQPIAMPWLSKVKAVLQMWWPGDEGGWATADVLLGRANPAGRLPMTWARQLTDYAANDPAHPERSAQGVNGTTTYSEGVDIGYRWFDAQHIQPLYPFGYGLSYTHFAYSDLAVVPDAQHGLQVSFTLKNTGAVAGDEVPQVYLDAPQTPPADAPAGTQFAPRKLAAFSRIPLAAGQQRRVTLQVDARALEFWSTATHRWERAGTAKVSVGASERDLRLQAGAQP